MASTFSTNLALELIGTGDQAGTWGNTTNTNLGTLLEQAISGYVTQAVATGTDTTITIPNGSTGVARNMYIELTGTGGASTNLIVPANKKLYFIFNNSTGAVTVKVSGQTGVSVPTGKKMVLVSNGTDIVNGLNYIADFATNSFTVTNLTASSATITNLIATSGSITNLVSSDASATVLRAGSATLTHLSATSASITNLALTSLTISSLSITNVSVASVTVSSIATFAAGSAAAPSITTTGDTNTGIFFPAADTIAFTEGGAESMRIDSSGQVGIGMTPARKLDVTGTFGATGAATFGSTIASGAITSTGRITQTLAPVAAEYALLSTGQTTGWIAIEMANTGGSYIVAGENSTGNNLIVGDSAYDMVIRGPSGIAFSANAGTTQHMRLDSSGNLGLGVTPDTWGGKVLQFANGVAIGIRTVTGGSLLTANAILNGSDVWKYKSTAAASAYQLVSGGHFWSVAGSGTAGNTITGFDSTAMTLSAAGGLTVGGTTDPGAGRILAEGSGTSHYVASSKGGVTTTYLITDANGANVQVDGAWPIRFTTNSTERARITSGGEFLINTTTTAGNGKFSNSHESASTAGASTARIWNQIKNVAASNNATVDVWLGRDAAGNVIGNVSLVGHFNVYVTGASGANGFAGVYSIITTGNGTSQATLSAVSTVTRGTSPVSSIQIANDGGSGAIKLTVTYINNAGVVTGGNSQVSFIGQII